MIAAVRGNLTNLRINCAGSRPATKSLAVRATWGYGFLNKSLLNAGSAHRGRSIKPANLHDRVRKTHSTNLRYTPPATKSP
jgi:hypothetical protein